MTSEYAVNVDSIEMVFPVTGHSYLLPDQVFATIKKEVKQLDTIINPEEYLEIISQFSTVKNLDNDVVVYDYKTVMASVIKPISA